MPKSIGKTPQKDAKDPCKTTVNIVCPPGSANQQNGIRTCLPFELVENGGFESLGVFTTFAGWKEVTNQIRIGDTIVAYEGTLSASFNALPTTDIQTKSARLFQNVTVNPGCFLALSFANNFFEAGTDFEALLFRARVFYDGSIQTNLINVEINYDSAIQAGTGYVFHQRVAGTPVPLNVSNVTVEFTVKITDRGTPQTFTQFFIDGVSLRAV
jgi:hypothetical protein